MKDTKTNTVNKISLKKTLKGLLIDNISEEQADVYIKVFRILIFEQIMLNYPNLDPKNLVKEELNFEDFRQIVKVSVNVIFYILFLFFFHFNKIFNQACNFKFDADGNLL